MMDATSYDDILVATDGGALARAASEHAIELASRFDATVHAVSVVNTSITGDYPEKRANAVDAVDAVTDRADETDVESVATVREGTRPYAEITDYRHETDADLIVMGTHGRSGVKRYLLGSVAERVIRSAHVPVLAVPPTESETEPPAYDSVLLSIDESEAARTAAEHGLGLAAQFDTDVHTLHADAAQSGEEIAQSVEQTLTDVIERARENGLDPTDHRYSDDPVDGIEAAIDEHGVDLVAMGTHGESSVKRLVLGSITERVLRDVHVPVLATPPHE